MHRRFRAFYLTAFAVALVGLVGSWFVAGNRVELPSQAVSLAANAKANDTRQYSLSVRRASASEPSMATLAVPDFFVEPGGETGFDFERTANMSPDAHSDYTVLFGTSSLP